MLSTIGPAHRVQPNIDSDATSDRENAQRMLAILEIGIKQGVAGIEGELAQRIEYIQMADSIFCILQEHAAGSAGRCEVVLNHGNTLTLQDSGEQITVSCEGAKITIETTALEKLKDVFVHDAFENSHFYHDTAIGEFARSLYYPAYGNISGLPNALQNLAPANEAGLQSITREDIFARHRQIDALYVRFKVAQPCYLGATYLLQELNNPADYILPSLLEEMLRQGKQIDFGGFFNNGVAENIALGGIQASRYYILDNKESLYIQAPAEDIKNNIDVIQASLFDSYPQGCIVKTGGADGHYNFYDTQNDVFYSGGTASFEARSSGISFKQYMDNYFENTPAESRETLTATDHTPQELADALQAMAVKLGVSTEEFLRWN